MTLSREVVVQTQCETALLSNANFVFLQTKLNASVTEDLSENRRPFVQNALCMSVLLGCLLVNACTHSTNTRQLQLVRPLSVLNEKEAQ